MLNKDHFLYIRIRDIISIKYFLLALIFVPPEMLDIIPKYSVYDKCITVLSFFIGLLSIIYYLKNTKNNLYGIRFLVAMLLLLGWLLFVNLVSKDGMGIVRNFVTMVRVVGYCSLILESYPLQEDGFLIRGTFFYCITIIMLNLLSQLIFGSNGLFHDKRVVGWQAIYVCGNANRFAFFFIFTWGVALCYYIRFHKNQIIMIFTTAVIVFSSFLSLSDMAKSVSVLMIMALILSNSFIVSFLGKHRRLILLIAGLSALWMIGFSGWKNSSVLSLVGRITEKRSFAVRGSLWNSTIEYIFQSPLTGYGTSSYRIAKNMYGEYQSAHNTYLQIMTYGGIPALILFIIITVIPFKINRIASKKQYYISVGIFLYLLVYLFEQNSFYPGYYALLALLTGETLHHSNEQLGKARDKKRLILWT